MPDPRIEAFNKAVDDVLNAAVALEEAKQEMKFRFQQIPVDDRREYIKQYSDAARLGEQ